MYGMLDDLESIWKNTSIHTILYQFRLNLDILKKIIGNRFSTRLTAEPRPAQV